MSYNKNEWLNKNVSVISKSQPNKFKKLFSVVVLLTIITSISAFSAAPSALANADLEFSVEVPPILEIVLLDSTNNVINDSTSMEVNPSLKAAAFNEKDITVDVGTNYEWGYNLVMSVPKTELTSASGHTISNLPATTEGSDDQASFTCTIETANDCDFTVNSWGFKIKNDTSIQSATNYISVPSSINLNKSASAVSSDKTNLSFGARINAEQAPGTYSTTIIFSAVANPDTRPIMQEVSVPNLANLMPNEGDSVLMKDARDDRGYTVTKVSDRLYWMTDNLRIMEKEKITAELSNFEPGKGNYNDGNNFDVTAGGSLSTGESYTEPRAILGEEKSYGVYYNYCAASAGTVCDNTQTKDSTGDICPAGWRLPTEAEAQTIINATSIEKNPVLAGGYRNGNLSDVGSSDWWWSGAATDNSSQHFALQYNGSWSLDSNDRTSGYAIRCVYEIPKYMQDVTVKNISRNLSSIGEDYTLYDERDEEVYSVRKIANNLYWMIDNLRVVGEVSAELSNFEGENFDINGGGTLEDGNSYTEPRASVSDVEGRGGYYNYCAASAGTLCNSTSRKNITEDICPAGWHIPTGAEIKTIANANSVDRNLVLNGGYYNGVVSSTQTANWWSATATTLASNIRNSMDFLYYSPTYSRWYADGMFGYTRDRGLAIRCVFSMK